MADRSSYGGQAVIEGVMIRGKVWVATAVRLKDGSITIKREEAESMTKRFPWLRLAFLRGTPAMVDSMRLGFRTLTWASDLAMEGEGQEKPKPWHYAMSIVGAMALAIGLFKWLPAFITSKIFSNVGGAVKDLSLWEQLLPRPEAILPNMFDAVIKLLFLVGYILLIGRSQELRRVFMYHGAEHKVVNAYEAAGIDGLNVEVAKQHSRIHPRCGTSFLFISFFVGIFVYSLLGWQGTTWLLLMMRLLLLPVIMGIAYELIRLSGKYRNSVFVKALIWPGLLLQRLTTAEPTDDQIEVAAASMRAVLEEEGVVPRQEQLVETATA